MSSTAFVAGATGYVGREVVASLVRTGIRTIAHVRPDSKRLPEWHTRFGALGAEIDSTPWSAAAMTATLEKLAPRYVFALLGTTRKRARAEQLGANPYLAVDYGLTTLLLEAAVAAGCNPRFIYLSSAGVGARSRSPYLAVRWRLEQELASSGLTHVIARPSFITGRDRDDRRMGERVGAAVTDAVLSMACLVGARRLRSEFRSTNNHTLASALVRLAEDPSAANTVASGESLR